jgi:hypothetical protein
MAWGSGTGIGGNDQRKEETHRKAHPQYVLASEYELISSADDSLNIHEPLVIELLDGGRSRIEI